MIWGSRGWSPRTLLLALVCIGLVAAHPTPLKAQQQQTVVVALVSELGHDGARAVVTRRPAANPTDVILVTQQTSPVDLRAAFVSLRISRERQGNQVEHPLVAPVSRQDRQPRGVPMAPYAKILNDLRTAPPLELPDVGVVPLVTVAMPAG